MNAGALKGWGAGAGLPRAARPQWPFVKVERMRFSVVEIRGAAKPGLRDSRGASVGGRASGLFLKLVSFILNRKLLAT